MAEEAKFCTSCTKEGFELDYNIHDEGKVTHYFRKGNIEVAEPCHAGRKKVKAEVSA